MHTKHSTLRSDYSFATVILAVALALGALLAFPQMARADEPVKEGVPYRIVSVSNPSVVAQFDADEPTVGEKGTIDAPDNTAGQVFTFAAAGDGSYYIRSYYNPALLLTADSLSVRGGVSARYATAGAAQTWKLVAQADGTYHIVSTKNTTYMLDTSGAVTQKGASLIMWFDNSGKTQKWTLQEVDPATVRSVLALPASGSTTSLVSVSNPNVAVQVDGSQVGMAAKADSDAQRFRFDLQADGTYRLSGVVNPDLFLTADSLSFRGAVTAVPGNASKAQNWILERQADGTWHLLSSSNSYYMLDTSGATTAVGASCIMWGNNNGATQKWTLGAASSASSGSSSGSSTSGSSSGSTAPASNLPDSSNGTLYRIVNVANPNVAVQYEGSVASGVKAVVASIANTNRQYFSITLENGSYVIRSAVDNSVVLASAKNDFRGAVRGETASGSAMQTWKIEPAGSGNRFHIVSGANSTWMLDTNGSYPVSGAACIMWADNGGTTQMWTFQAVSAESASTPTTVPSGYPDSSNGTLYRIVSVSNPRVSVQANHDLANGGSVSMAATSSSDSQLFRFEFADDGTYRIVSVGNPGMYLTPGSFMVNGDVFTMAEGNGKSQRWTLEDTGNGQYHIICADDPSLMLDTSGSTTQAGARVIMWYDNGGKTQKWTIQAVSSSGSSSSSSSPSSSSTSGNSGNSSAGTMGTSVVGAGTIYRIVNVANPNVAVQINGSSPSSGASVSVAAKSTSALQLFTVGEDDNGTIYLRSVYNPALVLTANSLSVRGSVNAYYSTSGKAQTWVLKQLSDGTYHIVSASNSTYMLDTNGSYPNAGASCIMWFDNGGDTQKWTLEEVDASSVTGALSLPATDGTAYRITSVSNAGVVAQLDDDAPAAGEAANMAAPDNGANQAFTFELQPDGTYVIRNLANQGLLLTADSLTVRGGVSGQAASSSRISASTPLRTTSTKPSGRRSSMSARSYCASSRSTCWPRWWSTCWTT